MQRKTPLTPTSRRMNRTIARDRATMCPGEFTMPAPVPTGNRKPALSRQSVMPGMQLASDAGKKPELENKDSEIRHLYDKYLQTEMMKLLMKRKTEEKEKVIVSQLAILAKEDDAIKRELFAIKTKESDLKDLIGLQNSLDEQLTEIKACLSDFDMKPVKVLKELQSMLKSLDVLKCKNIIIPETRDDMEKICDQFQKCRSLLGSINNLIGSKGDTLTTVGKGIKDFKKTYTDIEDYAKKCEEGLEQLQILVLKEGANSLTMARCAEHPAI